MKQYAIIFILTLFLLFSGCLTDSDRLPQETWAVGSYNHETNMITTDDPLTLIIKNTSEIPLMNNTRVLVYFIVDNRIDDRTAEIIVRDISDVSAPLIYITEDNKDDFLTNYAVEYYNMWIGQDYLTIMFNFWIENDKKEHKFFLSLDIREKEEDEEDEEDEEGDEDDEDEVENINLTFHHEGNSSFAYSKRGNVISVDINELKDIFPTKDSVELVITFPRTPNYDNPDNFEKHSIWYKY
ncbi:MAG: hypothetical protein FWH18_12185 [Marinilabiliaceae bacterium]|nr:hypothetical protein [Marinilabiliaceae bacterium]